MSIVLSSAVATQGLQHFGRLIVDSWSATFCTIYASLAFLYYLVWLVLLRPRFFSHVREIPGPRAHWFYGNFREITKSPSGVYHLTLQKEFPTSPFIRYHGLFYKERLMVNTLSAHQYVLTNCYDYPKPDDISVALKNILGAEGLLFVEGDVHKRQRKQMIPSFSYANLKSMVPIFWSKSTKLGCAWSQLLEQSPEVEVGRGLSATTLDIIGSAGFGYEFNAIDGLTNDASANPLASAYEALFDSKRMNRLLLGLTFYFPWIRSIPIPEHVKRDRQIANVQRLSKQLVVEKVAQLEAGHVLGSDIFSLLLKENKRKEAEDDQVDPPMTEMEISDQTLTLLAAGHETTSSGTSWALHALSVDQRIQDRLRSELTSSIAQGEEPSFEKIETLHYLNNFVKEVLRFYPPVPVTRRVAMVSATIDGQYVPKGTDLFIVPSATNKNPAVWGPDGETFNPDRWDNLPKTHNNYGMETFLHGSRGCIGQRFAMVEMKCLVAALVLSFKFSPKPGHVVEGSGNITQKPKGGLPLLLSRT